jgi:hypothetical protein
MARQKQGTRESAPCSNRGTCDRSTGVCRCYEGFHASNGRGQAGSKGDCGYYNGSHPGSQMTECPKATPLWASQDPAVCSGKMQSCSADFICNCTAGEKVFDALLASPRLASPRLASLHLASPRLISPCLALYCLALRAVAHLHAPAHGAAATTDRVLGASVRVHGLSEGQGLV